jgi:hypothetical protein
LQAVDVPLHPQHAPTLAHQTRQRLGFLFEDVVAKGDKATLQLGHGPSRWWAKCAAKATQRVF